MEAILNFDQSSAGLYRMQTFKCYPNLLNDSTSLVELSLPSSLWPNSPVKRLNLPKRCLLYAFSSVHTMDSTECSSSVAWQALDSSRTDCLPTGCWARPYCQHINRTCWSGTALTRAGEQSGALSVRKHRLLAQCATCHPNRLLSGRLLIVAVIISRSCQLPDDVSKFAIQRARI